MIIVRNTRDGAHEQPAAQCLAGEPADGTVAVRTEDVKPCQQPVVPDVKKLDAASQRPWRVLDLRSKRFC